ncbi:hypothetical protein ACQKGC_27560 [Allorhizobium pseudoryzae]|uniref:hypothetical protein n=1 Tax=Allorhizobium pseudoryzae TaxID=379684 RepID=UPI003D037844
MANVAVIGAGPSAIAAVSGLLKGKERENITVFEKGRTLLARTCPVDLGNACTGCKGICNVISGFGGSVNYGDSLKISRLPAGRRLFDLLGEQRYSVYENQALALFDKCTLKFTEDGQAKFNKFAVRAYPVANIDETTLRAQLANWSDRIRSATDFRDRTNVIGMSREQDHKFSIQSRDTSGRLFRERFDQVIVATGRAGVKTTANLLRGLGVSMQPPSLSVGVRIELPSWIIDPLGNVHPDFKMSCFAEGKKVKSFCFSSTLAAGGRLKFCHYQNEFGGPVVFLDGHVNAGEMTKPTSHPVGNFALLSQEVVDEPELWLEANLLTPYRKHYGGIPVFEPLGDFMGVNGSRNRRSPSTGALRPGSIKRIIPSESLVAIRSVAAELLEALSKELGISLQEVVQNGFVMAPCVEFFWPTVEVDENFMTNVRNLFVIGDAAGVAQGVLQAAISGIAAAKYMEGALACQN